MCPVTSSQIGSRNVQLAGAIVLGDAERKADVEPGEGGWKDLAWPKKHWSRYGVKFLLSCSGMRGCRARDGCGWWYGLASSVRDNQE